MKNKATILIFLLGLFLGGLAPETRAATTSAETTRVELQDLGKNQKKRKRYKGYKKPRNKKFLGIFKRRSSCDCPKH
ncbi:hypothetical protein GCM10027275_56000 [Rhabdobacter roseus]|uniref:Uncharacterized protein n=1 Tax=Rhabdobacter roseus TaxID=1655419 RepID=A0A840U1K8_9BACT|nr:hypothetical protein [Rhabdobacter roseus]MBB5287617.1 hypothetical protein [Rhabdobacter roseus]